MSQARQLYIRIGFLLVAPQLVSLSEHLLYWQNFRETFQNNPIAVDLADRNIYRIINQASDIIIEVMERGRQGGQRDPRINRR